MRDIDINRIPWEMEEEYCNNNVEEEEEDDDSLYGNGNGRCSSSHLKKKLRLTKEQSFLLEDTFRLNKTLNPKQKEVLAVRLKLKPRQVEVWFQNRRARSKQKQTEVECDYLKRWFTSLSEQNKRLHKEVEELRAIQLIPPHIPPAGASSTPPIMTMCPRCQHVTTDVHHHHAGAITTVAATTPASLPASIG